VTAIEPLTKVTLSLGDKLIGLSLLFLRRSSGPVRRTVAEWKFYTGRFPVITLVALKIMLVKILVLEWSAI
jgi:hypothetical protein